MKAKYLDTKNCHSLLPSGHGVSVLSKLEACLKDIDTRNSKSRGSIGRLIEQNARTNQLKDGLSRLVGSPIDIAIIVYPADKAFNIQAIESPISGPSKLHYVLEMQDSISWKAVVPLQYLIKNWGDANSGYQCYIHTISQNVPRKGTFEDLHKFQTTNEGSYYYAGITSRNWLIRLDEHMREIRQGNRRKFYQAWRDNLGLKQVVFSSALINVNASFEDAMDWEEKYVDRFASDRYGLNMIPGGFKGLSNLHKLGLTSRERITLGEREAALDQYVKLNPKKGIPNPFISQLWQDDEYYERINVAHPKRLSAGQVKQIRDLAATGMSPIRIMLEVDALNEIQVKKVIAGITYKRVK